MFKPAYRLNTGKGVGTSPQPLQETITSEALLSRFRGGRDARSIDLNRLKTYFEQTRELRAKLERCEAQIKRGRGFAKRVFRGIGTSLRVCTRPGVPKS